MATSPATAPAAAPTTLGLPRDPPAHADPGERGGGGGGVRDDEGVDGLRRGAARAAGVEAEPAEPEDGRAEHDHRHVVRLHRLLPKPLRLSEDERGGERGGAGVDVDRGAAGEVEGLHVRPDSDAQPS